MEFRILGPLEVEDGGASVPLGGPKQRAVLALLLLRRNEVVAAERLIDELWGAKPPPTAAKTLRIYASRLRKLLGGRIESRASGLVIRLGEDELDLARLDELRARAAGEKPPEAAATLRAALALFRGQPLADFAYEAWAQVEIGRLEELRSATLEDRIDADLVLGRHAELVGELEALIAAQPLRERLRGQLMVALYRSGRQAEALQVYQDTRRTLVEELGIDPTPELQRLEAQILRQDDELAPASPPPRAVDEPVPASGTTAPAAALPREERKTVTVLSVDLVGATALAERLDPEVLRAVTTRYLDAVSDVVRSHGGSVESSGGESATGIFGVPVLHDDDAVRALRAAFELRDRLGALDPPLQVRAGVASGPVLVRAERGPGEALATGDPVTVAGLVRQAAGAGEIIAADTTYRLARDAVRAETVPPLAFEGRSAPIEAYRVVELLPEGASAARRFDTALVGRQRELDRLVDAFEQAVRERTAVLFTLLGSAGIGKSRLAAELAADVAEKATFLSGRCLSYGEGTTFRPLAEIVEQATGGRTRDAIGTVLAGEPDGELVAARLAAALGQEGQPGPAEETFWAVRKLVQSLSRERPLVLQLDDVHWGEPTLLDLVEHLAEWTRDAPLLLLCLARTELLDERPGWGGGKLNATTMLLEPLGDEESLELIDGLAQDDLEGGTRSRILEAADGNPLFLEQMVALAAEQEGDDLVVPPTIQALLAARLDRLGPHERAVLERAAIEGQEFHRAGVVALMDDADEVDVDSQLGALFRKELVSLDEAVGGDESYRFRHILIRDAAYESMPKRLRGELHERFGDWLETAGADEAGSLDEIVGYHLEQAVVYRRELGERDGLEALAARAGARLAAAGQAAYARDDMPAAVPLIARACAVLPGDDPLRRELLVAYGYGLRMLGRLDEAVAALDEAAALAGAAGDQRTQANASVVRLWHRLQTGRGVDARAVLREIDLLLPTFERLHDELGLANAWKQAGEAHHFLGQVETAEAAFARALDHAVRAGDEGLTVQSTSTSWLMTTAATGPRPAAEGIALCERMLAEARTPRLRTSALLELGFLNGIAGDLERASMSFEEAKLLAQELGFPLVEATVSERAGRVALLAGDAEWAERELRTCVTIVERLGARSVLSTEAAYLARALLEQGRDDEAAGFAEIAGEAASDDDLLSQILLTGARARLLSRGGAHEAAEAAARHCVELARTTDMLDQQGEALLDLAEVLERAGRPGDAAACAGEAAEVFTRKQAVLAARRAANRV